MLQDSAIRAGEIMTREVVTAFADSSLRHVAKLMAEHRISGLPVIDTAGHLIGLVTQNDLLNWSEEPGERQSWWLNLLAEGQEISPEYLDLLRSEREKVHNVMNKNVISIPEDMLLGDIAKLLAKHKIKRVPVVRDGKLVGVVSRSDLISAFARA